MSLLDFKTPRFNIFVSSPVKGLEPERRAIKEVLESTCPHFRVWLSEDWSSDSHSSEETCISIARDCQLFILLLGKNYGKPPPGRSVSVTEIEFRAALDANRRKIRAYLKPAKNVDSKQAKFINQVRDFNLGFQCPSFRTLEQLKNYVVRDAITYYGNQKHPNSEIFQNVQPAHSIDPGVGRTSGQSFLVQSPPSSMRSEGRAFIERQRTYFHTLIHRAKPSKLATSLILDLSPDDRFSLALIEQGNILARRDYLESLFPAAKWHGFLQRMQRRGFLVSTNRYLRLADNIKKHLRRDEPLMQKVHAQWISLLAPIAGYSDLALALCLHLIALKKFSDAIAHAHTMVLSAEDHFTTKLFSNLLVQLRTKKIYEKLPSRDRILLLDGVGIFESHEGHFSEALHIFNAMLSISRRAKNGWGIAQALLHRGITWAQLGTNRHAVHSYRKAAAWARKRNDKILLARILHNLSQCLMADNPELASKLLEKSIQYKRRSRDAEGLFAAYSGRGILAGQAGEHKVALRWFRRAERLARKSGSLYEQSHALHNQSLSHFRLGEADAAVRLSQQALKIADALGRTDIIILTAEGAAVHCYEVRGYNTALSLFLRIYGLKKRLGDNPGAVIALSNAAVTELQLKQYDSAKNHIRRAISLSKSITTRPWLISCLSNHIQVCESQGKRYESVSLLKREIRSADKNGEWGIVADLARMLAQLLISVGASDKGIDQAWMGAIAATEKQNNILKHVEILRQRYAWIRQTKSQDAAIAALYPFLELTRNRKRFRREYIEALEEIATCLQSQEKYSDAETYYRRAFDLAKKHLRAQIPGALLNNYAELLRKTGRSAQAIPLYEQAIAKDEATGDLESRLLVEHNLALALEEINCGDKARNIFLAIARKARNKRLWEHHARAWLALANVAWLQNQRGVARRRYAKVRLLSIKYQLPSLSLHSALNEARLLRELDRTDEALSLLEPLQGYFTVSEYCLNLFLILGRCLLEGGRYKQAVKVFKQGLASPQAKYSSAAVASLRISLVEANLKAGGTRTPIREIDQVLTAPLPPEKRVKRLTELLSIIAVDEARNSGRGYQTQRLLNEIQRIAKDNKTPAWISETCEHIGHILWSENKKISAQFFIVGMISTVESGNIHGAVELGVHLGSRLHRLGLVKGEQSVVHLKGQIQTWLRQQLEKDADNKNDRKKLKTSEWLLWPFSFALTVLHRPDKGRKITLPEITLLLTDLLRLSSRDQDQIQQS